MAIISVRLNEEKEKMVSLLADELEKDKSRLIKHSLREMYEDMIDNKVIDQFEKIEKKRKPKFVNVEKISETV
ncbi:MAG: DUF6290 family protein [bacterium]|jgi:predicted transcriptional regulator